MTPVDVDGACSQGRSRRPRGSRLPAWRCRSRETAIASREQGDPQEPLDAHRPDIDSRRRSLNAIPRSGAGPSGPRSGRRGSCPRGCRRRALVIGISTPTPPRQVAQHGRRGQALDRADLRRPPPRARRRARSAPRRGGCARGATSRWRSGRPCRRARRTSPPRPPQASPSRAISASPRVTIPAFALSPSPSPSTPPAASAITFFDAARARPRRGPRSRRRGRSASSSRPGAVRRARTSSLAITAAAGRPWPISSAKFGPGEDGDRAIAEKRGEPVPGRGVEPLRQAEHRPVVGQRGDDVGEGPARDRDHDELATRRAARRRAAPPRCRPGRRPRGTAGCARSLRSRAPAPGRAPRA